MLISASSEIDMFCCDQRIASLALAVESRIASCSRRAGMSGPDSGVLDGSDSSSCITSILPRRVQLPTISQRQPLEEEAR